MNLPMYMENNGFYIDLLTDKYRTKTVECLTEVFLNHEPISTVLNVDKYDYDKFSEIMVDKGIKDRISLICIEPSNKKVVGFLISEDYSTTYESEKYSILHKNFKPLISILGDLDSKYRKNIKHDYQKTCHVNGVGLNTDYLKKLKNIRYLKLSDNIFKIFINLVTSYGFKKCIAHFSNIQSQIIAYKLGFEAKYEIDYATYEYNNQLVFSKIDKTKKCILMEKTLQV